MKMVALIPARSGSERVKDKNIRLLNGKSLMSYSIDVARKFGQFSDVICCTDKEEYADIARALGASVPYLRDSKTAGSQDPDISWIKEYLDHASDSNIRVDALCILRPTNPFRTVTMLNDAFKRFTNKSYFHSLRAVSPVKEHPAKMWRDLDGQLFPIMPYDLNGVPMHSNQNKVLPDVYVQNASLEMVWTKVIQETGTIAGSRVQTFITDNFEGFDINEEIDFIVAEQLLKLGLVKV